MSPEKPVWLDLLKKGAQRLRVGDHDGARHFFLEAHALAPHEPLVALALGRERMRQGKYREAHELLRFAWEREPDFPPTGLTLARLLGIHMNRPEEAQAILERLGQDGTVPWESIRLVRGEILLRGTDEPEAALQEFREVLERGDASFRLTAREGVARAHNAVGLKLVRQGRHEEAVFAFKRAANEDPDWATPRVNLGAVFHRLGNTRRAHQEYRRALALEPDNPTAMLNLARLAAAGGNLRRAVRYYRRLLQFYPRYPGVRAALARLLIEKEHIPPRRPLP